MATPSSAASALPSSMPGQSAQYQSKAPSPASIAGCCSAKIGYDMAHSEIDAIRTLLTSKPRPVGWAERRQPINEGGSTWPGGAGIPSGTVECDRGAGG